MRAQKVSLHINEADGVGVLLVNCESHELTYNPDTRTYKVTFVDGLMMGDDTPHLVEKVVMGHQAFGFLAVTTPAPDDAEIQKLADEAESGYGANQLIPQIHKTAHGPE